MSVTKVLTTVPGKAQRKFERKMSKMGIWAGAMGFHVDGSRYVNDHVQWMWEQFLKR